MRKTLILTLATATAAFGTAASAQAASEREQRPAEMTRAEVQEHATAMFARMDVNSDGRIDADDREARQEARFERLDADGDGAISKAEFDAAREIRSDRREERRAANLEGGERMARGEGRRGHRMLGRGGGMFMLRNADGNDDDAVSLAEFTAAMLARFDAADADDDGTVTREERRAQHRERRANRHGQTG